MNGNVKSDFPLSSACIYETWEIIRSGVVNRSVLVGTEGWSKHDIERCGCMDCMAAKKALGGKKPTNPETLKRWEVLTRKR